MQFNSSVGRHRSGTGSQMKRGFSMVLFRALRARRMAVTRSMHRVGEQIRWKDFERRREGVKESVVRRSLGVVYLKARFWDVSYPFQPRVLTGEC